MTAKEKDAIRKTLQSLKDWWFAGQSADESAKLDKFVTNLAELQQIIEEDAA